MGGEQNGIGPLKPVLHVSGTLARRFFRPYHDVPCLAGAMVVAGDYPVGMGASVNDVRIVGTYRDVATFATADDVPIALGNGSRVGSAGNANGGVVLLGAVHLVRNAGVSGNVVELSGGLVVDGGPGGPTVEGDASAAVVALDHSLWVMGVNPKVVIVGMRNLELGEVAPSINRFESSTLKNINGLRVLRVRKDVAVVPRASTNARVIA